LPESDRSSDSGLPPSPPSRLAPVASWRGSISPHSGGTVPDSHRVPSPRSVVRGRAYHRTVSDTARPDDAELQSSALERPAWPSLVRLWLPVVAWAVVIFAFSSIPSLGTGLGTWDLVLRKLAHVTEYAVLGALLLRATGRAWMAVVLGVLYAASDELHQTFVPGRHGRPLDVAIDTVGLLLGVVLWRSLERRRTA